MHMAGASEARWTDLGPTAEWTDRPAPGEAPQMNMSRSIPPRTAREPPNRPRTALTPPRPGTSAVLQRHARRKTVSERVGE